MRFTLYAILPAVFWTLFRFAWFELSGAFNVGTLDAVMIFAVWFLAAAAIGLYWSARIVRFALRTPRAR